MVRVMVLNKHQGGSALIVMVGLALIAVATAGPIALRAADDVPSEQLPAPALTPSTPDGAVESRGVTSPQGLAADLSINMSPYTKVVSDSTGSYPVVGHRITILNNGNDVAQGVRIVVSILDSEYGNPHLVSSSPQGLNSVSPNCSLTRENRAGIRHSWWTCTVPPLPPNYSAFVMIELRDPNNRQNAPPTHAEVTSTTPDPNVSNNVVTYRLPGPLGGASTSQTASQPTTPLPTTSAPPSSAAQSIPAPGPNWTADLGVTMKAASNPAQQEVSYDLGVLNIGKDVAHDVRLALALREPGPPGVRIKTVNSPDAACRAFDVSAGNPVVVCTAPALAAKAGITVNVVLSNPGNGTRYSIAQVMSVTPDPNPGNNWATNIGHGVAAVGEQWLADLAVTLTGSADPTNQQQTYQLNVTNQGDDDAREIVVAHAFKDAVPGTTVLRIDPRGATCSWKEAGLGLPVITCTVPQLGVRSSAGATILLRNPGNVPRTSTVQAMSFVPDFNRADNAVTTTVPPGNTTQPPSTTAAQPSTQQQPSAPPATRVLPPTLASPLPPSSIAGIIQPLPLQRQPQAGVPAQQMTHVPPPTAPPMISRVWCNAKCLMLSRVTVTGQNLAGASVQVIYGGWPIGSPFGSRSAAVIESTPTQLVFELPVLGEEVAQGFRAILTNSKGSSGQSEILELDLVPRVTGVAPLSGVSFNRITLTGVNLHMTKEIWVNTSAGRVPPSVAWGGSEAHFNQVKMGIPTCTGKAWVSLKVGKQGSFAWIDSPELSCE